MGKKLPLNKRLKQRLKGTHDSPCLSICTHKQGDLVCKACGMIREEKKGWKQRAEQEKIDIRLKASARFSVLGCESEGRESNEDALYYESLV